MGGLGRWDSKTFAATGHGGVKDLETDKKWVIAGCGDGSTLPIAGCKAWFVNAVHEAINQQQLSCGKKNKQQLFLPAKGSTQAAPKMGVSSSKIPRRIWTGSSPREQWQGDASVSKFMEFLHLSISKHNVHLLFSCCHHGYGVSKFGCCQMPGAQMLLGRVTSLQGI